MRAFLSEDLLLTTAAARALYRGYAAKQPIIDHHCHIDPREIYEDRQFDDMAQLWLGGDHYKRRLLRTKGVEEKYISGDGDGWEKFRRFAAALPKARRESHGALMPSGIEELFRLGRLSVGGHCPEGLEPLQ